MSDHERDKVVDCLFSGQTPKLNNIKFCRGTDRVIDEDLFKAEVVESLKRVQSGKVALSDVPPPCRREPLDLTTLIADM